MDTREDTLKYLGKVGSVLKPFYDFETKVYGFQEVGKRKRPIFLISGIIFIFLAFTEGSKVFLAAHNMKIDQNINVIPLYIIAGILIFFLGGIGLLLLKKYVGSIKRHDELKRRNEEFFFLREQDSLKLQPFVADYKKYETEFPKEFYNFQDVLTLYNLIKTQQADNLKEAFQVLRNRKFQQEQRQQLNNIQNQQNIIQRKQNLALVSQLLMSNKQNVMQRDINKLKKR